jgi:hypothetical protein
MKISLSGRADETFDKVDIIVNNARAAGMAITKAQSHELHRRDARRLHPRLPACAADETGQ